MALIQCDECGKEYSDKASSCANCGCPTAEQGINARNQVVQPIISTPDLENESEDNEKKNSNGIWGFLLFCVVSIVTVGLEISDSPTSSSSSSESNTFINAEQLGLICQHYIGHVMHRDPATITHYKTDTNQHAYVKYTRSSDNTVWSWACKVENSSIVWAAWLKDTKEWGRWRQEDKAKITYNNSSNSINLRDKFDEIVVINLDK